MARSEPLTHFFDLHQIVIVLSQRGEVFAPFVEAIINVSRDQKRKASHFSHSPPHRDLLFNHQILKRLVRKVDLTQHLVALRTRLGAEGKQAVDTRFAPDVSRLRRQLQSV
jgi:hypothetical protein